eukprot:Skav235471  [mRNA]  locus=scaffold1269:186149:190810:+ [translate_table: standard]
MPAPPRTEGIGCIGGKQVGVTFLSSFPARTQKTGWDSELYEQARLFAGRFLVGEHWIHGGIAYGYSAQSDSSAVCDETNLLLRELTKQVEPHVRGLKFFGGDFNQHPGRLAECKFWEECGYLDIQDLAYQKWGIPPSHTCKSKSRKDYLYLSPDLQRLVVSVVNRTDLFPDHSALYAKLNWPSKPSMPYRWRLPAPIPYEQLHLQDFHGRNFPSEMPLDATEAYQEIWNQVEQDMNVHLSLSGQKVLPPDQCGRGMTMDRTQLAQKPSPPKLPRQGDPAFEFSGHSSKHVRWYSQLKRLTNLRNMQRQPRADVKYQEHVVTLWSSIRRAVGFGRSFLQWWQDQHLSPTLPHGPPSASVAEQIVRVFEQEFRKLEQHLIQTRRKALVDRYAKDANSIFADVRTPAHASLETILVRNEATVLHVPDPNTAVVEESVDFDVATPVMVHHEPVWLLDQLEKKLWFEEDHSLAPGDVIHQSKILGQVSEIHAAFETQWTKRWDRHREVDPSKWDPICEFIDVAVPQGKLDLPPITLEQWMRVIRSKKARSAMGLDGVSRKDLLQLPPVYHQRLLLLFDRIEQTAKWPKQFLEGAVYSLAKITDAEQVSHYRPITVLPMLFRIWSTIRARTILRHIATLAKDSMKGNMPAQTSVSIWWKLQQEIENCHYDGTELTGTVADLVKAFNLLPRKPVFHMARRIGVPEGFVRTWEEFTGGLTRRFFIDHQPSGGVQSHTGFPEGDPLSVCAMALLNLVTHEWMDRRFPTLRFVSYVDNFQVLGPTASDVLEGLEKLTSFLGVMDIEIDTPKTFCWSTSPDERRQLRDAAAVVNPSSRDLGGHMQYIAKQTNLTVAEKCLGLTDMWTRLKRSAAPRHIKLKVLQQKAWPSAMHGISTVHMRKGIFTTMRSQAVEAIYRHKRGANPTVQLSLVDACRNDPEFFALQSTVLHFRQFAEPGAVESTLQIASETAPRLRKPGPCGVVISRLEQIGWTWLQGTQFLDQDLLAIDLLHTPIQELHFRIRRAWCRHVATLVMHRDEFGGIEKVDVAHSRVDQSWDLPSAGLLRSLQIGTFVTADKLHQAKVVDSPACEFCGAQDSLIHRNLHCPGTDSAREGCPAEVLQQVAASPPCVHRGWILEPSSLDAFRREVDKLQVSFEDYQSVEPPTGDTMHLFTDGTAMYPNVPQARLAAWGLVLAASTPDDHGTPLTSGGVPGWQTVLRAEICAVISALGYASRHSHAVVIWIDNQQVIHRMQGLLHSTWVPTRKSTDHDLWYMVSALVNLVGHRVTVQKIDSHQDESMADEWQAWAFRMNDAADKVAARAISQLPSKLVQLSHQVATEVKQIQSFKRSWHQVLLKIANLSLNQRQHAPRISAPVTAVDTRPVLDLKAIAVHARTHAPASLRFEGWLRVLQWLEDLQGDPTEPAEWVTWPELHWSLQMTLRCRGLRTVKQNEWALVTGQGNYTLKAHTRSLSAWIMNLVQLGDPEFTSTHVRPSTIRFQKWAMCIHIRRSTLHKRLVNEWIQQQLGNAMIVQLRTLEDLPSAIHEDAPVFPTPCVGLHVYGFR